MTAKGLRIAEDLVLPLEAATEKLGFLGRTGSGKTYAAQLLAERFHGAGVQFVGLDPVGKWWSLRLGADGKHPGLPIPVFGGLHGDIPLEPTAGKLIADVIVDRGISAVVDVSQFESDRAKAKFVADFGDRLFWRKKAAPSALHVFIEEAQEFVPQNPNKDERMMLHHWTRIQKLGRNFGIGTSLLSQRPQEVNKKVLNQTEILFVFQLTGTHERRAVEAWIGDKGLDEDIEAELPKLERGHPHVWSPALLQVSRVVQIGAKRTFDASSTPKVGGRADVKELAPIDLEQLRTQMATTIERAKAEDPKELRKQLAERDRELRQLRAVNAKHVQLAPAPAKEKRIEVPVLRDGQAKRLEAAAARIAGAGEQLATVSREILEALRRIPPNGHRPPTPALGTPARLRGTAERPGVLPVSRPPAPRVQTSAKPPAGDLVKGELRILSAIAQHEGGVTREQLTVLTGYKRSSRDTYLQRLGARGLIEPTGDTIRATAAGVEALGADFEPLPTGDELRRYWLERLGGGERAILELLCRAWPASVPREWLSEQTGYKRSSRDTYLQKLAARRLVEAVAGGVQATEALFG